MTRFTRYVLAELLKVFGLTLAGLTSLMIVGVVAVEAHRQGLGITAIVRLMPYVLPNALLFAVPGTILFAVCTVYGRMAADNEVVAIKSVGISPLKIIAPAIVLAFMLSLVTVCLNDVAVSWGRRGINRVVIESVEQIAYGMLRTQHAYSTNRFSINVASVRDRTLVRPTLVVYGSGEDPPVTLTAQEAVLRSDLDKEVLVVALRRGTMEIGDKVSLEFHDTFEHEIPLRDAARKADRMDKPSYCPLRKIAGQATIQRQRIAQLEQSMAVLAAFQLATGDLQSLASPSWQTEHWRLTQARERLARLRTEPWRRWANGFSCLCFVVVGVPWAILRRNADLFTSFGLCFLPILLVYYPLLLFGLDRAKGGELPPYSVWLGNLILLLVGFALIRRVMRY